LLKVFSIEGEKKLIFENRKGRNKCCREKARNSEDGEFRKTGGSHGDGAS